MSTEAWTLLFSFPDESPSFSAGFEAGMIWAKMEAGQASIRPSVGVRISNTSLIEAMAASRNYQYVWEPYEQIGDAANEWIGLELVYSPKPKIKLTLIAGGADE